jgi:hypothetical protein
MLAAWLGAHQPTPTYKKAWRDWENEQDGDRNSVLISRPAACGLVTAAKAISDAAPTPWENEVTSQSFINVAATLSMDYVSRIKPPALYVVQENDPFAASPESQRKVFAQVGRNADCKVIAGGDEYFGQTMVRAVAVQIDALTAVFARVHASARIPTTHNVQRDYQCTYR